MKTKKNKKVGGMFGSSSKKNERLENQIQTSELLKKLDIDSDQRQQSKNNEKIGRLRNQVLEKLKINIDELPNTPQPEEYTDKDLYYIMVESPIPRSQPAIYNNSGKIIQAEVPASPPLKIIKDGLSLVVIGKKRKLSEYEYYMLMVAEKSKVSNSVIKVEKVNNAYKYSLLVENGKSVKYCINKMSFKGDCFIKSINNMRGENIWPVKVDTTAE